MLRAWRRAAVVALAGGAAIAAQLVAIAPAEAAGPTVTITASSKLPIITHDVLVVYKGGAYAKASVHGNIADAKAGEVAVLYAQPFPYKKAAARVASKTFTSAGNKVYSFTVTPTLATRYQVKLYASHTASAPLAMSRAQYVYVTPDGVPTPPTKSCTSSTCHAGFSLFVFLPSSALAVEMGKHVYPYFDVNLSTGTPPAPTWLYLNRGNPTVKVRGISSGEFEITLGFTFSVNHENARWNFTECQRDTVTKDGLGLPGSHGCGASRVSPSAVYLG